MFSSIRSDFSRRWLVLLAILAVAGVAWGAKLMLIRAYGSDVPYMDQWDAQAGLLYIPAAEHHLTPQLFWWPHNEHRVLLTRLTNYGLTIANRQWDPLLEMSVNAALHAALAAALLALARRQTRGGAFVGVALVVAALFALPFAWENTLAGFQSQFYFLAWTALGFLWLALPAAPLGARWWAGVAVGLVGLGSMSSGFLCAAAALGVVALRAVWCERRWTWRDSIAALVYLAICVVGAQLVNPVPGHAYLKVTSFGQWLQVFCHVLAWPANQWLGAVVIVQLPLVAFLIGRLRARRLDGPDAVLLGLALWIWGQVAAVAYSRGNGGMGDSPRYYDLYAIGIVLNAIALTRGWRGRGTNADSPSRPDQTHGRDARATLLGGPASQERPAHVRENLNTPGRWHQLWPVVAVVWVAALAYGLREQTAQAYRDYLTPFPSVKNTERRRLADFIRTGDVNALHQRPEELPHNSADSLAHFLSHPGVRRLLSVGLRSPLALQAVVADTHGFAATPPDDLPGRPDAATVWRAARGPARFVSEPLPADCLPVLRLTFAGDPELTPALAPHPSDMGETPMPRLSAGAGGTGVPPVGLGGAARANLAPGILWLESADGHRTSLQVQRLAGDRWQTAHLPLPTGGAVRLVAELPAGDHWLAFADPAEMGRGSWYAYNLRKGAGGIFWGSIGLLALALAALGRREPPEGGWRALGTRWWGELATLPGESRRRFSIAFAASRALMQAWPNRIAAWPRPAQIAVGIALLAGALFLRKPDALLHPQLWAEDGSIFLIQNESLGLRAWWHPYQGYLHLVMRLVAWVAGFADPAWIPAFYNYATFIIWLAVLARCWSPRLELPAKAWLPLAFLFTPHTGEVLLVMTNLQWITAFVLLQQTFMRPPATWWGRAFELLLIGLVGLTGPHVIIFWPLLGWAAWRRRGIYPTLVLAVATLAAGIQTWHVVHTVPIVQYAAPALGSIGHGFAVVSQRLWWADVAGASAARVLPGWLLLGSGVALIAIWIASCRRPPVGQFVWFAVSAALIASLAAGVYRGRPDTWSLSDLGIGDRYFFIPRVLLGWLLIWLAIGARKWPGRGALAVIVVAVGIHLTGYRLPAATDYHWAQHCSAIRRGEPANIPILPDGWTLEYPGRPPG
jgi:hypothetical protein